MHAFSYLEPILDRYLCVCAGAANVEEGVNRLTDVCSRLTIFLSSLTSLQWPHVFLTVVDFLTVANRVLRKARIPGTSVLEVPAGFRNFLVGQSVRLPDA